MEIGDGANNRFKTTATPRKSAENRDASDRAPRLRAERSAAADFVDNFLSIVDVVLSIVFIKMVKKILSSWERWILSNIDEEFWKF